MRWLWGLHPVWDKQTWSWRGAGSMTKSKKPSHGNNNNTSFNNWARTSCKTEVQSIHWDLHKPQDFSHNPAHSVVACLNNRARVWVRLTKTANRWDSTQREVRSTRTQRPLLRASERAMSDLQSHAHVNLQQLCQNQCPFGQQQAVEGYRRTPNPLAFWGRIRSNTKGRSSNLKRNIKHWSQF